MTTCLNRRHYEYRTWPIALPMPRRFKQGDWPSSDSRLNRTWARLRSHGLIRMRHVGGSHDPAPEN